jgi:uncharacterized protein
MNNILEQLNRVRGIGGSLLLSSEGLPIATSLRNDIDEDDLSASLGAVLERSLALCERAQLPSPGYVQLQSSDGGLLLLRSGPGYLAVLTDPQANLALLQLEIKPYVEALAERMAL